MHYKHIFTTILQFFFEEIDIDGVPDTIIKLNSLGNCQCRLPLSNLNEIGSLVSEMKNADSRKRYFYYASSIMHLGMCTIAVPWLNGCIDRSILGLYNAAVSIAVVI